MFLILKFWSTLTQFILLLKSTCMWKLIIMNQEIKRLRIFYIGIHYLHNTKYCKCQIHVSLQEKTADIIKDEFPFTKYFENAPQPIFKGRSYAEDMDMAEGCFRHIRKIFTQLEVRNIVWKLLSYYLILKHCSWILFTTQKLFMINYLICVYLNCKVLMGNFCIV